MSALPGTHCVFRHTLHWGTLLYLHWLFWVHKYTNCDTAQVRILLVYFSPMKIISTLKLPLSSRPSGSAEASLTLELIQPGLQVCCPASSQRTAKDSNTPKHNLQKDCLSSALIPGHWRISRVLCHLKLTLRNRDTREREWAVKHTLSFIPSHYIPES